MRIPCFDVLIELLISLIVIVLQYRWQIIEDVPIRLFRKVQLLENALLDPFFDLGYILIVDRPFNTLRLSVDFESTNELRLELVKLNTMNDDWES